MPTQRQQRRPDQANVVRAQGGQQQAESDRPQQALVAVTRELDNRLAIIEASGIAGIRPDRLKLVALTAFTRTPALWTCTPVSVARSIVEAAQLGLEPTGLLGGAYLVPRGQQCTLLVGYRGLVILALRSQMVQRVEARVVREKDKFEYAYGLEPYLHHVPSNDADPGPYTGAYAIIFYRDGSRQFDYMSKAEIEEIRKRSASPNAGPWLTDTAEMYKKTPLRRLMKLAPLTVEVAAKLDELDPEVIDGQARDVTPPSRQAELREKLQGELMREYGTAPGTKAPPAGGDEVEGESREVSGDTTQGAGGTGAQAQPAAEGAQAPSPATAAPQEAPAGSAPAGAPADRPASKPERVSATLGATCGVSYKPLDVGPCALPAGHGEAPWRDTSNQEHPPQKEHQEAGGTRWTQPPGA